MGWSKEQKEAIAKMRVAEGVNRNFWYEVKAKADIDFLQKSFGGFHDSVLTGLWYQNARWTDGGCTTDSLKDEVLSMYFRSQWVDQKIELRFTGVRRFNLVGYKDNYSSELFDCYLAFHNNRIIFADTAGFDIEKDLTTKLVDDGTEVTFVVAESLIWRFLDAKDTEKCVTKKKQ